MNTRYFTFAQAQARVPELSRIFATAGEIRAKAKDRLRSIRTLEKSATPDVAQAAIEKGQLEFLARTLEQLLRRVETMGAVLKGLEPGLVDFPHRLDGGEEVYLCWREGEKALRHYHGVNDGFSGRKPLPRRRPGDGTPGTA